MSVELDDIIFNVGKIRVTVHRPSFKASDEANKKALAKYLYKLLEISNNVQEID